MEVLKVVNCFQITTLVEDSQVNDPIIGSGLGCELLSDYYFSRRFTGHAFSRRPGHQL